MYTTETVTLLKTKKEKAIDNAIVELNKKIKELGQEYTKEKRRKVRSDSDEKQKELKINQIEIDVKFYIKQRNELLEKLYGKENA